MGGDPAMIYDGAFGLVIKMDVGGYTWQCDDAPFMGEGRGISR